MSSPMPDLPNLPDLPYPPDLSDQFGTIAELVSGAGVLDELARAAKEHGIMITVSFIPATDEAEDEESS